MIRYPITRGLIAYFMLVASFIPTVPAVAYFFVFALCFYAVFAWEKAPPEQKWRVAFYRPRQSSEAALEQ